ncbi:MAG: hypothetical protein EBV14_05315 [Actinobacteria bacterium]|nr:hypothetical protein [Actinomycetota bacterium]
MPRPLDGVRVLDFTRVLAGPHATRMLCDLGAEVIKVEPPVGDLTRFGQPRLNSLATYFIQQNVGKLNVSLNLDDERGVDIARRLAAISDVVIENFRPGVMARLGLGYEQLAASNPRLVYASISGYGATGPWVDRRAYAPVVNAEAGITKHQGDVRGGAYANDPFSHGDVYTGMETAAAILAALLQRERTGRGQFVDVSMAETLLYVNEKMRSISSALGTERAHAARIWLNSRRFASRDCTSMNRGSFSRSLRPIAPQNHSKFVFDAGCPLTTTTLPSAVVSTG